MNFSLILTQTNNLDASSQANISIPEAESFIQESNYGDSFSKIFENLNTGS